MVSAETLIKLLDFNLSNKLFDNAAKLLEEEQYRQVILSHYPEVIHEVLSKHLTADNYTAQQDLYNACELTMKLLAEKCHQEGILFEFLEIIETVKDDDVFTSILKCLQVVVLQQSERKSRALEYCLNSIEDYILELPLPDNLLKNAEQEEEKILENNDEIRRVLMMYMTVELFYEPVVQQIVDIQPSDDVFRSNKFNRRNVLFCFVLRLLGKPLSYLDLGHDEESNKVKTYSHQVAENMIGTLCKLHTNIFQLLSYVETRCRWPATDKIDEDLVDIFLHQEKLPLIQLGMLFYLVTCEEMQADHIPKVHHPAYIFQTGIYLVNTMITSNNAIIFKGLKLCRQLLENIASHLSSDELDLKIHRTFCQNLVKLLIYSPSERNRKTALLVLKSYIQKFDTHGRFLLIKNILKISSHKGLVAYLTTMYKDIIFEELRCHRVSEFTSGPHMKQLVMDHLCNLAGGAQCDIAESSDQIASSLSFLLALVVGDKENVTGIKDLIPALERGFLAELRSALDLSRAHYLAEIKNVKSGKSVNVDEVLRETKILNDSEPLSDLTNERKLDMLQSALTMFDLLDYRLAHVNETIKRLI